MNLTTIVSYAALHGNFIVIDYIIKNFNDIDFYQVSGYIAKYSKNLENIIEIIDNLISKYNIGMLGNIGPNAAKNKNLDIAMKIINHMFKRYNLSNYVHIAYGAAMNNCYKTVNFIIEEMEKYENINYALVADNAIKNSNSETAELLLNDLHNKYGVLDNTFYSYMNSGHLNIINYLLINNRGHNFFMLFPARSEFENIAFSAARHGHLHIIEAMFKRDRTINFNEIAANGACNGHAHIIEYVAKHVEIDFYKIVFNSTNYIEVVKQCIKNFPFHKNDFKKLIEIAIDKDNIDTVNYIAVNFDITFTNKIAFFAAKHGCDKIFDKFIDEIKDFDEIVQIATENGHLHILNKFINRVGNFNELAKIAVTYGHLEILNYIFECGFTINTEELMEIAIKYSYLDIIMALKNKYD
jgi:hypothetical protein